MKITTKQYAQALLESTSDEKNLKKVIERFACILVEHNATAKLDKIISNFEDLWNKKNNIAIAEITSAKKLDKNSKDLLDSYISELLKVKNVKITEKTDKNILGGFVVKTGDKVLDGSLRTRIDEFKNNLVV